MNVDMATYKAEFLSHEGGEPVLLWPDTFTNHFEPDVAIAAVRALEDAGFTVQIPRRPGA